MAARRYLHTRNRTRIMDRIEAIRSLLAKSPQDVFLHYSLGMELSAAGDRTGAAACFRRCIELDQQYLPAYVEAGKTLRAAGEIAAAREVLSAGLELARAKGDAHTADYIRQQLEGLGGA